MKEHLLVYAILVPAVAGLVCYILGRRFGWLSKIVGLAAAAWVLGLTWRVLALALRPGAAEALAFEYPWFAVGGLQISVALRAGVFSAFIGMAVSAFSVLILIYSLQYFTAAQNAGKYGAYILWTVAGSLGAVYADHLIFFLICWEIITVMLFMLVNQGGGAAAKGAMKSFVLLGLADCAMLLGIAILWASGMAPELGMSPAEKIVVGSAAGYAAYILLMVGALAKAGAMPLHTWVPAIAQDAPTPVMAFLPASLDKLLGIYFLAILSLQIFVLDDVMRLLLMIIGAATILGAVMMAMIQHNLKRLLSFHAVSQVGYMVLGIGTGVSIGIMGGLFHMLNNAIYKCSLFLMAGSVEKQAGTSELEELGGLGRAMPVTFLCGLTAALAISGVPPLNGFASKWMVYQGVLKADTALVPVLLAAAIFGSALTLASFVKVLHSVFLGARPPELEQKEVGEPGPAMLLPMIVLAALCVLFGIVLAVPMNWLIGPAVQALGVNVGEVGIWTPGLATVLLIGGLVIGAIIYLIGTGMKVRVTRTFVGGEVLTDDRVRFSGTGFYGTIRDLPMVGPVYRDAERLAFDIYHLGARFGGTLVQLLRSAHTGVLPVYVSWCLIGLIILIIVLVKLA